MRYVLFLSFILFSSNVYAEHSVSHQLILGVFANRSPALMREQYEPLVQYLDEALGEDVRLQLRILNTHEMEAALRHNQLDFVLTNPSHYLVLRSQTSMTGVLATLVRRSNGQETSALGGTIVVAKHSQVQTFADLKGQRVAMVDTHSLGGYQAQMYELMQQGVRERDLVLQPYQTHDEVIAALLKGDVDVGFVSTGVLEDWKLHHLGSVYSLRILNEQNLRGYPYKLSTRLYPEWPLISMPHLDQQLVRRVSNAVLALPSEHPAAIAAQISGFMPPSDYSSVEQLARVLKMPPYDYVEPIQVNQLWQQYRSSIVSMGVLFIALLASLAWSGYQSFRLRQQRAILAHERQSLKDVIWGADVGTWEWNVQTGETRFNDKWAEMIGYTLADLAPVSIQTWIDAVHPEDRKLSEQALRQCFDGDTFIYECEVRVRHRMGQWIWVLDRGRVLEWTQSGEPLRMSGTHLDITDRRQAQDALRKMAYYDGLTQLPNRVLLTDRLNRAMALSRRYKRHIALVFLDLDGFKAVNDSYGHNSGDFLLIELSTRIQHTLRDTDTLARIGGDEFVLVLSDLESTEMAEPILERILSIVSDPVLFNGITLQVSASMGVVYYPDLDDDAERLLRYADQAMYHAKNSGKNQYSVYTPSLATRHVTQF